MSCVATLKKEGLKLTPQRRLIVDVIHDTGAHLTAEDIISYVHSKMPQVNKSTIYRTLELLEKNECVFKSESGNLAIYHHAEEGHHHHLVCQQCGKTTDCDENLFLSVEKSLGACVSNTCAKAKEPAKTVSFRHDSDITHTDS